MVSPRRLGDSLPNTSIALSYPIFRPNTTNIHLPPTRNDRHNSQQPRRRRPSVPSPRIYILHHGFGGRTVRAPEIASKFHLGPNIYRLGDATSNPMRREYGFVPAFSFVVLRFVSNNPGLWAFHCHITWHLESGLMMQFAGYAGQGLEKLEIPPELVAACPTTGR